MQVKAAWAAAAQVVLSGVTGTNSWCVSANGRFEQVEREVYAKAGNPDSWLFVAKNGSWMVGDRACKDARKTGSGGWAGSVALAGGMPLPARAGRWKVHDGSKGWVEQTIQIMHG